MTFNALINDDKPVLVDFTAEWCAPCHAMKPVLEVVKAHLGPDVHIYHVNVDQNPTLVSAYHVKSIPTLILFKNGEPQWRQSGIVASGELIRIVGDYIQRPIGEHSADQSTA